MKTLANPLFLSHASREHEQTSGAGTLSPPRRSRGGGLALAFLLALAASMGAWADDTADPMKPVIIAEDFTAKNLGEEIRIPFGISNPDNRKLVVSAASGKQALVKNDAIRIEGEGDQRTLVIDEVKGKGEVLISIAVYDGAEWMIENFKLALGAEAQQ